MPFISIGEWGPDCQTMNLVVTVLDAEVKCVESHDIHLRYSR